MMRVYCGDDSSYLERKYGDTVTSCGGASLETRGS
jgi:hypothetical protein